MRIVFMGTPDFAVPSLKALCENEYDVVGVITQPDKPRGRGNKVSYSPVKKYAMEQGIKVFQPVKIRKDGVDMLKSLEPDLCITAAFGQILSQEILDIPTIGTVNVHASLLPKHRGSAPVAWSIMCGDKVTGVTTMMTSKGIDDGDMLLKSEVTINQGETCGELTERLSLCGASLLLKTLDGIIDGTIKPIPQDNANMTYDPMLKKEMGIADWSKSSEEIINLIHGLNPWPGVNIPWENGRMKLLRAKTASADSACLSYGNIVAADSKAGFIISCGNGEAVEITQLQVPGGKPMSARDYFRGHKAEIGASVKEEEK